MIIPKYIKIHTTNKSIKDIPKNFEDKIEQAYYYFMDKCSSHGGNDRDYFKDKAIDLRNKIYNAKQENKKSTFGE